MRWFRRPADPHTREGASTIEIDGIRYDGRALSMPQARGAWDAFSGRIRRVYRALVGNGEESRSITSLPWSVGDSLTQVSASQERALRMGPVWSALRLITDTVSTLPIHPYRRQGELRLPATMPQLFRLLDESGQLVAWLARCVASLMLRGNAYGLVTARDGMQFPTVIQWLDPDEVSCDDTNPWAPIWYWRGQPIPTEDFLHIPWVVIPGKVQGLSPIEAYQLTVATGIQAQEYGSNWFANGGIPPGTFKNSQRTVDQTTAEAISQRLISAVRSRRPIVYGFDWDYNAITVPPEQAQFIETMKLSAAQIAAIYGIPPEEIGGSTGDSMTYVTDEMNQIKLARSLRPLLVRLENAFSSVLPSAQRVKLNADATARADLTSRYAAYQVGLTSGFLTIDEIRALEDLPPLPAGAPRPMPQLPGQQARKFNPGQKRDPDGQFADGIFGLKRQAALDAVPAKLTPAPNGHTQDYTGEKLDAPAGAGSARALSEYEGVEYQPTNQFLRGKYKGATGEESFLTGTPERIAEIDKTMSVSRLQEDVVVYRAIQKGGHVFGDDWMRGVVDPDEQDFDVQDAQYEEWEAGKRPDLTGLRWAELGYSSTTVDENRPAGFGRRWHNANSSSDGEPVIMTIRVPKGTGAVQLSGMDKEAEILLQRGLVMEVTADHGVRPDGFRHLDITVVGDA